jgi:hypothetical protein
MTANDSLNDHVERLMDLREKGVRDALVRAGWTPPKEHDWAGDKCSQCGLELGQATNGPHCAGITLDSKILLSKALRAICIMREYCPERMPATEGWEWFDVGSEISKAIPHDEWAREFRSRVEIDLHHRDVADRLRSLAITKIQEGIMWLGMDLKAQNEANPYPESKNPDNVEIAPTADGLKL